VSESGTDAAVSEGCTLGAIGISAAGGKGVAVDSIIVGIGGRGCVLIFPTISGIECCAVLGIPRANFV
jgi:hypothetical protein